MVEDLRITVLVENTAARRGVLGEHGLALWVEADGRKILFDTGQGMALGHNAQVLNIDLAGVHAVVLSHGHYDHTGGLAKIRAGLRNAEVYVHPAAFDPKYSCGDGETARFCGAPAGGAAGLEQDVARVVATRGPTRIAEGIWVTGEIPRRNSFEDSGGRFSLDEAGTKADPLIDDQAMYVETARGVVVLLGCAHAGVVNTLEYVPEVTGQRQIRAVVGGLHLVEASDDRISRSIAVLRDHDVQLVGPVHCTGLRARARILDALPDRFAELGAGSVVSFQG